MFGIHTPTLPTITQSTLSQASLGIHTPTLSTITQSTSSQASLGIHTPELSIASTSGAKGSSISDLIRKRKLQRENDTSSPSFEPDERTKSPHELDDESDESDDDSDNDFDFIDDDSGDTIYPDHIYNSSGSDESSTDESEIEELYKYTWKLEQSFEKKEELDNFLKQEKVWSIRSSYQLEKGTKTYYRCNMVKKKGAQCDAAIYVLQGEKYNENSDNSDDSDGNTEYQLYRKSLPHNHQNLASKKRYISERIKTMIINYYTANLTALTISLRLREDDSIDANEQPNIIDIRNVIQTYTKNQYGKNPLTMRQLTEFVDKHMNVMLPDDIDEAFIVHFVRSEANQKQKMFRYFISTVRLLQNALNSTTIHADATYKLTTEKLPIIVIGTTDMKKSFHLIGITVSNNETADAYAFSFNAMKIGMRLVNNIDFNPKVLMSDADPAIHKGFKEIFGEDSHILMCYAHVIGNVQRKYKFVNKEQKEMIKKDLYTLHLAYNEQLFDQAFALFKQKWIEREPAVIQKLEKSFFKKNKYWFIGSRHRSPTTNNATERFNGTVKLFQMLKQRKPLKQFNKIALKIVQQRSRQYRMDKLPFQTEVDIEPKLLQEAKQPTPKYFTDEVKDNGEVDFYVFSSRIDRDISKEDVENFKSKQYDTFEDYEENAFMIHTVTFPHNVDQWKKATCSCPSFDKSYICKHIVAIACDLELVAPEVNYDDDPLFQSMRGRPKKQTKALQKD